MSVLRHQKRTKNRPFLLFHVNSEADGQYRRDKKFHKVGHDIRHNAKHKRAFHADTADVFPVNRDKPCRTENVTYRKPQNICGEKHSDSREFVFHGEKFCKPRNHDGESETENISARRAHKCGHARFEPRKNGNADKPQKNINKDCQQSFFPAENTADCRNRKRLQRKGHVADGD